MDDRSALLEVVKARLIEGFDPSGAAVVLDDDALTLARHLWDSVADPWTDDSVLFAVGWLHWLRWLSMPDPIARPELARALEILTPLHLRQPDGVPVEVASALTGAPAGSDTTVQEITQVLEVTASAERGGRLLARALSGETALADAAVAVLERSVTRPEAIRAGLGDLRSAALLGAALIARYEGVRDRGDLDRAVVILTDTVATWPADRPGLAAVQSNLGAALRDRYNLNDDEKDLDAAVSSFTAVLSMPGDSAGRAATLSTLGAALLDRARRRDDAEDLDQAIAYCQEAVDLAGEDGRTQLNLATCLMDRYRRICDPADQNSAIDTLERAVATLPTSHQLVAVDELAHALRDRYERTRDEDDLARAINMWASMAKAAPEPSLQDHFTLLAGEALAAAGKSPPGGLATFLGQLARDWQARYVDSRHPLDLDRAIDLGERSLTAAKPDDPGRSILLANLGRARRRRYELTARMTDLNGAVAVLRQAAAAAPRDAAILNSLGLALRQRYLRTGDDADASGAVDVFKRALAVGSGNDPEMGSIALSNLAAQLQERYRRTQRLKDLDGYVRAFEESLAVAPQGSAAHAGAGANLAVALLLKLERSGEQATASDATTLDRAVELLERALAVPGVEWAERREWLSNLASALLSRDAASGPVRDLDRAIELLTEATWVPHGSAGAKLLANLASALLTRHARDGRAEDYVHARVVLRAAATDPQAPELHRAQAQRRRGAAALSAHEFSEAVEAYSAAVELLGRIAPAGLQVADRHRRLAELVGIGPEAAAACLEAGQPEVAVELVEQGRGVVLSEVLDARTDLAELNQHHPVQAEAFRRLTAELNRLATHASATGTGIDDPAVRRLTVIDERDALLALIRSFPKFEHFLLPQLAGNLLPRASEGTLVVVNVAGTRSDALLLRSKGIDIVPLPAVTPDAVTEQVVALLRGLTASQDPQASAKQAAAGEAAIGDVLGWLWDAVTGPVLDRLEYTSTPGPGERWPTVLWCPTGALSFLPLHAAGHHELRSEAMPPTVLDRVVSSSTPTLRASAPADPAIDSRPGDPSPGILEHVLVVAMPVTPGEADLPGAATEATALDQLLPGLVDTLGLPGTPVADRANVTALLGAHTWVHFSCHGVSDPVDPSAGRLLLSDHTSSAFTVLDLMRARSRNSQLAYLSACSTAQPGAQLPDEPLHLAAACLLAGYRHVVATLWQVDDQVAALTARSFYGTLTASPTQVRVDGGSGRAGLPDTAEASVALHRAVRTLRALYMHQPSRWAAYVHLGR